MKATELKKLIREEIEKVLTEAQAPAFQAKHQNNNLVAAIYFSWTKNVNNEQSLWEEVIQVIERADCKLINYIVTDSVCEFEFQPTQGADSQDQLENTKNSVTDALKPMAGKFTGYDVYIAGN